jgi:hypothetical protein
MFNLDDYEPVEKRLGYKKDAKSFWEDYPDGRIFTKLVDFSNGRYIVQAFVYRTEADQHPWTTGLAEETITGRGVNATSALENAETSAIGRALATAGYATKGKRPSREEMAKVASRVVVSETIKETKAKMAETASEYVPVPKEEDPWTMQVAAPVQTMEGAIETVKSILGGTTESDIQRCPHGEMIWKTGTTKAGKPWGHWRCMNHIQGDPERCEPRWYEIDKETGLWKPQVKK